MKITFNGRLLIEELEGHYSVYCPKPHVLDMQNALREQDWIEYAYTLNETTIQVYLSKAYQYTSIQLIIAISAIYEEVISG